MSGHSNRGRMIKVAGVLELLAECVLPGCRNPVEQTGMPCGECRRAFGNLLREIPDSVPMTAEEIATHEAGTRAAYAAMTSPTAAAADPKPVARVIAAERSTVVGECQRKRNQVCWLCEERHTCSLLGGRWECDTCRGIT